MRAGLPKAYAHQPCYRGFNRSIPLLLIAVVAFSDARNAISRLDACGSFEPTTIAALAQYSRCCLSGYVGIICRRQSRINRAQGSLCQTNR
jgi:hypothetical protein